MGWFKDFFFGDMELEEEKEIIQPKKQSVSKPKMQNATKIEESKPSYQNKSNFQPSQKAFKHKQKTTAKSSRNLEMKMVYQYPKGEFRFPAIPDKTVPEAYIKQSENNNQVKQSHSNETYENELTQKKDQVIKKKPFVASEVPSPVFAFKKRPSHFEFNLDGSPRSILEEETASISLITDSVEKTGEKEHNFSELSPDQSVNKMATIEQDINTSLEDLDTVKTNMVATTAVNVPEPTLQTTKVVQKSEAVESNQNSRSQVKDQQSSAKEVHKKQPESEKEQRVLAKRMEQLRKTRIPFNVMMVNQDKRNIESSQQSATNQPLKENEKPVNKEEETSHIKASDQVVLKPETGEQSEIKSANYFYPSAQLLSPPVTLNEDESWLNAEEQILNETFTNFNVNAVVVGRTQGPAVTRFEVQPEKGVKVSKITNLTDDIKLSLAAKDIRIEAPIPGKNTVGIEIPNPRSRPVMLSELLSTEAFIANKSPLTAALGLDISGTPIITDLQKMPHGLIAGATGSGKSVCINSLLVSLLYKASPDELKLLLIDPKMVELAPYNRIPHLVSPVITDAKAATAALKWAVEEMERRYQLFSHTGVRNMEKYNEYASHPDHTGAKLPYILIVIDELADLMMVAPNDVEESISRIAQKARACGIHMIVATQRPSVDVITGLIKANIPTRISFSVSSSIDSRTILDTSGAERLLGKGDMLFLPSGVSKPVRLQGTFVSDEEIDAVVEHVRRQAEPNYLFEEQELLAKEVMREEDDELFDEACEFVMKQNSASTSLLQRHFRIGYNRAARLMEMLENYQIVSGNNGSKPRDVIITHEQLEKLRAKKSEGVIS